MKSPIVRSSDNLLTCSNCTADFGYPRSIVKVARERAETTAGTIPRSMKEGMKHVISGNTA
jgi:hypothetical protein